MCDNYAEMRLIYERIDSMWENGWHGHSGFLLCVHASPGFDLRVVETDNWQCGWKLLKQWVRNKLGRENVVGEPFQDSLWAKEVHIWSHVVHSRLTETQGHTLTHARLEEELAGLILGWLARNVEAPGKTAPLRP